jgi:DNA-binding protein
MSEDAVESQVAQHDGHEKAQTVKPEVQKEQPEDGGKAETEGRRTEDRSRQSRLQAEMRLQSTDAFKPKIHKAGKMDNVVYVGKKPAMSYVLAVITQFSEGHAEVFVKARGRSIATAVDVVEIVRKKFLQGLKCELETDTEVITDERNQRLNVSTLSAKLVK